MCKTSVQRWDCDRHIYRSHVELCHDRSHQIGGEFEAPRSCPRYLEVRSLSERECSRCKEILDTNSDVPTTLKWIEKGDMPTWSGNSSSLITSMVPTGSDPREFSLRNKTIRVEPPIVSASEFVPRRLVEHLMRNKKTSAIAVKYEPGDEITNMEGVFHTFITPIVKTYMFGDYIFKRGHDVSKFSSEDGKQRARQVLMSAAVQMDFENHEVMLAVCQLGENGITSAKDLDHDFYVPSAKDKADHRTRSIYDRKLRKYLIGHLLDASYLPSLEQAVARTLAPHHHITSLEDYIKSSNPDPKKLRGYFIKLDTGYAEVVSLEMLFNAAIHQIRNEFSALERVSSRGYIYTYDPPSIFAQMLGADLSNRIMLAALKTVARRNRFKNMRAYAFNDYADPGAMRLLKHALENHSHVKVMRKADLFKGPRSTYDPSEVEGGRTAWLVVHNNSDAFGQNIESELSSGSLDGALGANSDAAVALLRDRRDLLRYLV